MDSDSRCSHSLYCTYTSISTQSTNSIEQNQSLSNLSFASDLDKFSLRSDNDSGMSSSSLLLPPALPEISFLSTNSKNRFLTDIVQRHSKTLKCQLCHFSKEQLITRICEQCQIGYCDHCQEQYHPMRGPFLKHSFIDVTSQSPNSDRKYFCQDHVNTSADYYCLDCRFECCQQCSRHINHEVLPIHQAVKKLKMQLSLQLNDLSEKGKSSTDFLTKLKRYPECIKENGERFQKHVIDEIDNLLLRLKTKKEELINCINDEIKRKLSLINQQYSNYNEHIQQTTIFLRFSIEALKQSDPYTYLQICHNLNNKCIDFQESFSIDYECETHTTYELDWLFNSERLCQEIHQLHFQQIKPPCFISQQCVCHDDDASGTTSGILSWSMDDMESIQGFILELDNGIINSEFRKVYHGDNTICAIDGLISSYVYTARVKAYNQGGTSVYSECITLHSPSLDCFVFNPRMSHFDIEFLSTNFDSISCKSLQERIALGSRGFRQGVHYWKIMIESYDKKSDPAFGIARFDVSKQNRLGKDCKSWCMYIDDQRSWFMHNGEHINRIQGGISIGSIIGVLLDLNKGTLTFYINDQPHGFIAFSNLPQDDIYYPAVSLNKNVRLTLISGLNRCSIE